MNGRWIENFTPIERGISNDLEAVVNSFEWFLYAGSGLTAILLFIIAAHRSKNGDATTAFLSSVGAILCAIAPIIAKSFSIGG